MGNQIADYTFTIVEDGQVALAGNFDTFNFTPVIMVVVLGVALLLLLAYTLWFETHSRRIMELAGINSRKSARYFFHPVRLLRDEMDVEYSLAAVSLER